MNSKEFVKENDKSLFISNPISSALENYKNLAIVCKKYLYFLQIIIENIKVIFNINSSLIFKK